MEDSVMSVVTAALPDIDESLRKDVCNKVLKLGLTQISDVQFIERADVEDILPPFQVRKLIDYCQVFKRKENSIVEQSNETPSQPTTYVVIDSNNSSIDNVCISVAPFDWAQEFEINWNDFPNEILVACENKTRPLNKYVSQMIRIISSKIMKIDIAPGRKNLRIIAQKVVNKYPDTFQDSCIESVIAGGSTTIMKKLEDCIDNQKRRSTLVEKFSTPTEEMPSKKIRKTTKDSLGCINWQPADLPLGETKETQLKLKNLLIAEFEKNVPDDNLVKSAMSKTYATQRFYINSKKSISEVRKEWPFLLEEKYILLHYQVLVGKDILQLFQENLPIKCKKIFEFMECQTAKARVSECVKLIALAKERLKNSVPEVLGAFLLLLAYFEEEERYLLQIFKDLPNTDDVENKCPVLTPFLGIFGNDIYNAGEYVIFLDGKASTHTDNIFSAMAILFSSYYVFNIEYPTEACVTMEFIQRVFGEINPERGTKSPKNKQIAVKKVLNLSNKLMSFKNIFNLN